MLLRAIIVGLALVLGVSTASAQCNGNPAAGRVCGNPTAAATLPSWATQTALLDRAFGTTQGTVLNRGASTWSATATPFLGANGGNGGALILEGATSGAATISVQGVAGNTSFHLPVGNGTLNQVLITDGAGNTSWSSAGAGTVSSVGLSMPGIFTVTNSPVTSAGTLTATLNTETANTVWAGPTTGAASAPTFRALVGVDLPNPSATTLGGIESLAAVTSNWIRAISTSGVPTASQPAFTDISGTLAPAQCPNPSASTLGCVESYVAVASQWINSISTSGVPSSTQPNFTDLAGATTLAQLPSISSSTVLGNNSGGTSVPSALSATNVLDFIGTTQGNILYRNGTVWTALSPGTNGQVLATGGPAANPAWQTVTGTGTVTSVATNNGLTGGPITTTGTVGLATITAGTVLANITGGSAIPIANTPSSLLDLIGASTGNLLYRSSGGWTVLAPGTNGQVLTQGASTPAWGNAGTVSNVTITAGTGLTSSGTCNISTTGTCTVGLTITPRGASINLNNSAESWVPPGPAPANNKYHLFIANATSFNQSSLFVSNVNTVAAFTPPTGSHLIQLTSQVWATSGVAATGSFVTKWYKNATVDVNNNLVSGTEVCTGVGNTSDSGAGSAIMQAVCWDQPSTSDYYNVFMFIDSITPGTTTVVVDGNPFHTFAQAVVIY